MTWFGIKDEDIPIFLNFHQMEKLDLEQGNMPAVDRERRGSYWEKGPAESYKQMVVGDSQDLDDTTKTLPQGFINQVEVQSNYLYAGDSSASMRDGS